MKFHPRLSRLQSDTLFRIKKLMKSEFVTTIRINNEKVQGVDLSDSYIKINGKYIFTINEDYVFDSKNNKIKISELLKEDLTPLNEFLRTFVLDGDIIGDII